MDIITMHKDIIIELPDEPADNPWARLPPPPRTVSLAARWRLLTRGGPKVPFQLGLYLLAWSLVVASPFSMRTDPLGTWRLNRSAQTVPGQIEQVDSARLTVNNRPVVRVEYTFRLPNGKTLRGTSYSGRKEAEGRNVVVEYWPQNPDLSRIQGMRTGAFPSDALPILAVVPLIGLALIAVGTHKGRKRIRLLVHGLPALATIEAARFTPLGESNPGPYLPFAEIQPGLEARPGVAQRPTLGTGGCLWIGAGVAVTVLTLAVCGALFGMSLSGDAPMRLAGRPVSPGMAALFIASCGLAAAALGVFMIVQGGRWHAAAVADDDRVAPPPAQFSLDCRFVFQKADGQSVQADDNAVFLVEPGRRFEAQQWVLYDPRRPTLALLAAGLGDWPFSSRTGASLPDSETV